MTVRIQTKTVGMDGFISALDRLDPNPRTSRWLPTALKTAALHVQSVAADKKIKRGEGKSRAAPLPDKLTSRTGTLRRSIGVDLGPLPFGAAVGTELVYGLVHELGLGVMPQRPFLRPAVEDETDALQAIFLDSWTRRLELGGG